MIRIKNMIIQSIYLTYRKVLALVYGCLCDSANPISSTAKRIKELKFCAKPYILRLHTIYINT